MKYYILLPSCPFCECSERLFVGEYKAGNAFRLCFYRLKCNCRNCRQMLKYYHDFRIELQCRRLKRSEQAADHFNLPKEGLTTWAAWKPFLKEQSLIREDGSPVTYEYLERLVLNTTEVARSRSPSRGTEHSDGSRYVKRGESSGLWPSGERKCSDDPEPWDFFTHYEHLCGDGKTFHDE